MTPPREPTIQADDDLAAAAALGDRASFTDIVHRHGPVLYRYAWGMLHDHGDAEDAVQEALIRAWRGIGDFRGEACLRTWLLRITARSALNSRRRRRPVPVDDALLGPRPAGPDSDPWQHLVDSELTRALRAALDELPWRQRASWLLREVEGLGYDEIADVLATSPTVVRGQLHRARRTLSERMARWR